MGMVQVPYATVTVKYVRALIIGHHINIYLLATTSASLIGHYMNISYWALHEHLSLGATPILIIRCHINIYLLGTTSTSSALSYVAEIG